MLVSSARRTLQTLEALTPFEDGALIEPMDALYLAPWRRLLELTNRTEEEVREDERPLAERRVRSSLVLLEIA